MTLQGGTVVREPLPWFHRSYSWEHLDTLGHSWIEVLGNHPDQRWLPLSRSRGDQGKQKKDSNRQFFRYPKIRKIFLDRTWSEDPKEEVWEPRTSLPLWVGVCRELQEASPELQAVAGRRVCQLALNTCTHYTYIHRDRDFFPIWNSILLFWYYAYQASEQAKSSRQEKTHNQYEVKWSSQEGLRLGFLKNLKENLLQEHNPEARAKPAALKAKMMNSESGRCSVQSTSPPCSLFHEAKALRWFEAHPTLVHIFSWNYVFML